MNAIVLTGVCLFHRDFISRSEIFVESRYCFGLAFSTRNWSEIHQKIYMYREIKFGPASVDRLKNIASDIRKVGRLSLFLFLTQDFNSVDELANLTSFFNLGF